jgi:endo-1,4-beta-xylanase
VNPVRVGFMGFSAGGELAVLASTKFDTGNPESADAIDPVARVSRIILWKMSFPGLPLRRECYAIV